MKLIRLTTEDDRANFDNSFHADLTLKKDGKIALQNLAVHLAPFAFEITDNNRSITYQNSTAGERTIKLDKVLYTEDTYPQLLDDIQNKLNDDSEFTGGNLRVLGIEWKAAIIDNDTKVVIEYKRGLEVKDDANSVLRGVQVVEAVDPDGTDQLVYLTLDGVDSVPFNDFSIIRQTKKFISRGCGFTRAHIWALSQSGTPSYGSNRNGMILSLTDRDMFNYDPAQPFLQSDIKYGLWATVSNTDVLEYKFIVDGDVSPLNLTVPNYDGEGSPDNDDFEILINGDTVEFNVYQLGVKDTVHIEPYLSGQKLYPVEIYKGGNQTAPPAIFQSAAFSEVSYTPSPYDDTGGQLQIVPFPQDTTPYENYLRFASAELSSYLGYALPRQPIRIVSQATYKADYGFSTFQKHDAFLVELTNIPLDSYDGYQNQRKNLLAVVPVSDRQGEIIFETNTPFFIDIKNESELLLRNIRARILQTDYSPLPVRGVSTLTILAD
jgi:hypothetical protein